MFRLFFKLLYLELSNVVIPIDGYGIKDYKLSEIVLDKVLYRWTSTIR